MSELTTSQLLSAAAVAHTLSEIVQLSLRWQLDMISGDDFADRVADLLAETNKRAFGYGVTPERAAVLRSLDSAPLPSPSTPTPAGRPSTAKG